MHTKLCEPVKMRGMRRTATLTVMVGLPKEAVCPRVPCYVLFCGYFWNDTRPSDEGFDTSHRGSGYEAMEGRHINVNIDMCQRDVH